MTTPDTPEQVGWPLNTGVAADADDDGILRSKARALARSVWDEHRKTAVMTFETLSFEAREIMVDCCLKGMCVGIIAGSDLVRDDAQGTSAGTAETGTGSGRQPAGPVPEGDAPETSISGDPKCPKK